MTDNAGIEPYNWIGKPDADLLHLVKEQRIEQMACATIKHSMNLNNVKLLREFNEEHKPVALEQLQRKLNRSHYRNANYENWREEIGQLAQQRKNENVAVPAFKKATMVNITSTHLRWSDEEIEIGEKIIAENKNEQQKDITKKIFVALKGRTEVAISVSIFQS